MSRIPTSPLCNDSFDWWGIHQFSGDAGARYHTQTAAPACMKTDTTWICLLTTGKWKKQLLWILHRRPRRIWKRISADTWNSYLIKVQVTLFCQPSLSGRSLWTWLLKSSRAFETPRCGIFLLECLGNRRTCWSVQNKIPLHVHTCGYYIRTARCAVTNLYLLKSILTLSVAIVCVETCANPVAWALIIRHFSRPGKMQRKNSFLRQNKLVKLLKPKVQIKMLGQPVENRQESGHIFWYYTDYIHIYYGRVDAGHCVKWDHFSLTEWLACLYARTLHACMYVCMCACTMYRWIIL